MPETPDIGQLASLARTALSDPRQIDAQDLPRGVYVTEDPYDLYAIARLDDIIGITDPYEDEREFERCADSLDALGKAMERIREQFEASGNQQSMDAAATQFLVAASTSITDALDLVDAAVSRLRDAHEAQVDADLRCEDCEVNGDDCREHGEAWKIARRAIRENPERVLALLREEKSL